MINTGLLIQRQSQTSPTRSKLKLKRAKTAVEKPRPKKPLRKYGTESSRDVFAFQGDSDGEVESPTRESEVSRQNQNTETRSSGDTIVLKSAKPTFGSKDVLELSSMPPPASKSVSLEQSQGSEADPVPKRGPDTTQSTPIEMRSMEEMRSHVSTYSDGRMPTPTMSSRRSDESHGHDTTKMEDLQGTSRPDTDTASLGSVKRDQTPDTSPQGLATAESTALSVQHKSDAIKPIVLLPEIICGFEENDELSLPTHGPETWSTNQTTCSNAQKRKRDHTVPHSHDFGSDDSAVGLPKDQYQPRPSKSRSGRGTEEVIIPVDFSKRPEVIAKKKRKLFKRSKTPEFDQLKPQDDSPGEDSSELRNHEANPLEVDFLPELPEETNHSQPKVGGGTDDVRKRPISDPTPPEKPTSTRKQRGRPKKVASKKVPEENPATLSEPELDQVGIDKANPKDTASGKKVKKGANAKREPVAISKELIHDSDDELGDVDDAIQASGKVINGTSSDCVSSKPDQNTVASPSPSKAIAPLPNTPQKANSPADKGPDKHSPISSGKVAYRVGLSKRARIAPLLRMVRKT